MWPNDTIGTSGVFGPIVRHGATIGHADSGGVPPARTTAGGTLDTATVALNLSYYFLDGPLTPFLMGGIGWTFLDSNIPSGPPKASAVGPLVRQRLRVSTRNTYTQDYFSYNLGLGARWDVFPGFFLRGSVGLQWVDLAGAGTTTSWAGGWTSATCSDRARGTAGRREDTMVQARNVVVVVRGRGAMSRELAG